MFVNCNDMFEEHAPSHQHQDPPQHQRQRQNQLQVPGHCNRKHEELYHKLQQKEETKREFSRRRLHENQPEEHTANKRRCTSPNAELDTPVSSPPTPSSMADATCVNPSLLPLLVLLTSAAATTTSMAASR
eukprot:TRINITY_DN1873_c0_g1_i3.p2 TRINITY_DN1873_c0_g1~~TRINITY_DN1873_c0_g1_i3.p2  ORF type:complete len:131 (-),score=43.78 TRINITY_DN1873_c0_g1_i3:102-494(-)